MRRTKHWFFADTEPVHLSPMALCLYRSEFVKGNAGYSFSNGAYFSINIF